jgi:hypothetical protein
MSAALARARAIVAAYFEAHGDPVQARIVRNGGGDDFPEVQVALLAQTAQQDELARYRRALALYADADFWDGDIPETTWALHDRGETARLALAGRELFDLHRD